MPQYYVESKHEAIHEAIIKKKINLQVRKNWYADSTRTIELSSLSSDAASAGWNLSD